MSKLIDQVQSSELSRNPLKVFSAAELSPITVTRRDGEDLVLMARSKAESGAEFMVHVSKVMSVLADPNGLLVEKVSRQFPWITALDDKGRVLCAERLIETTIASVSINAPALALNTLSSWKETAYAISMGFDTEEVQWLDKPVLVKRPS